MYRFEGGGGGGDLALLLAGGDRLRFLGLRSTSDWPVTSSSVVGETGAAGSTCAASSPERVASSASASALRFDAASGGSDVGGAVLIEATSSVVPGGPVAAAEAGVSAFSTTRC